MNLLQRGLLILTLALLTACTSTSTTKLPEGLYRLQSLTSSGTAVDAVVTLKLAEDFLVLAGPKNTLGAQIEKNIVGQFTLIENSGGPLDPFSRILLHSLEGSTLKTAPNGNLLFIKNKKTLATFSPLNTDSTRSPTP